MPDLDYKSLSLEYLRSLYKDYDFPVIPMWHQLVSLTYTLNEDIQRVAYLHGVGTGKTLCALLTNQCWDVKKTLVICPSSAFGAWERDIKTMKASYTFLTGSKKERLAKLQKKKDYYIINYEGLKTIYAELKMNRRKPWERKKKWMLNQNSFKDNFECIILDEIHKCTDTKSLQSNICYELSLQANYCIGLTGTPLDKNMLELFNIYKVIDLGESLGLNFWYYRNRHFNQTALELKSGRLIYFWNIKSGHQQKILDELSGHTISFDRRECFDLPKGIPVERPIFPTKEFLELQDKIIQNDTIQIDNTTIDCTGTAMSQKLSQLSAGFLYYVSNGERKVYRLKKNPKVEALIDYLDDSDSKVIVAHKYTETALMIEEALDKHKIKYISVRGGLKINRPKSLQKFTDDESIRVLLVHPTCAAEGFDGTISSTVLFFSPIASPKIREQLEGRVDRKGQTKQCYFLDFILKHSVDALVNSNRAVRKSLVDTVMEYVQTYKKPKKI